MIKAVFFDFDGTLYSHASNRIPASTLVALQQLREENIKIILCTGRAKRELEDFNISRLSFDYEILLNGSLVLKDNTVVFDIPISQMDKEATVQFFKEKAISVQFIEKDRMYISCVNSIALSCLKTIHTPIPPLEKIETILNHSIYQMIVYDLDDANALSNRLHDVKLFTWTKEEAIDFNHKDAGKGKGMAFLEQRLGLKKEEIIAFGDGDNDVEMLERAGIAIAMGNGSEQAKKQAGEICEDIDDDGIYNALKRHQLIR